MGLSFLSPLFALGLAAIAIPIIVHLVHKERKETTLFPSLMFLRRVPYRHSSRKKLRDLVLFAARVLAFFFIVAAFTRPFFDQATTVAAPVDGRRDVVVLLDRSFSMRYGDRWDRAVTEVRAVIDGLTARDRLTLIPFDLAPNVVNEATSDRALLRVALDSIQPTDAGTRFAPALAVARRLLTTSPFPNRELVVVSDFQRSGFDLTDEAKLPAGVLVNTRDVVQGDVIDRAIRGVELHRTVERDGAQRELITISARIGNTGPVVRGIEATLVVSGRTIETKRVDLPSDGGAVVTFSPIPVPVASQGAEVRLTRDILPHDDVFNFVFERTPVVNVLVVESPDAATERGIFLTRALEIGDQPPFDLTVRRANILSPVDLSGRHVIILNDAWPPAGLASRLRSAVEGGAGLIVASGERLLNRPWPLAAELLPSPIAAQVDRIGERGAVLGFVDATHPALSLFGAARSGDLSAARFFRYRPVDSAATVLARFDDGSGALAERRVGRGRVLQFASSFDGFWNDLPRQPVFLPFLHQLVRYAADYRDRRNAYSVGEPVDQGTRSVSGTTDSTRTSDAAVARIAEAPSGKRVRFGGDGEAAAFVPMEQGIYAIRRAGAPGERPRLIAVNVSTRELEFSRFDPTRLVAAVTASEGEGVATTAAAEVTPADKEREQSLWWYLLLAATILLVGESLLARRLSIGRSTPA